MGRPQQDRLNLLSIYQTQAQSISGWGVIWSRSLDTFWKHGWSANFVTRSFHLLACVDHCATGSKGTFALVSSTLHISLGSPAILDIANTLVTSWWSKSISTKNDEGQWKDCAVYYCFHEFTFYLVINLLDWQLPSNYWLYGNFPYITPNKDLIQNLSI